MRIGAAKIIILGLAIIGASRITVAGQGIMGDTVSVSRQIPSKGFVFGPFVYPVEAGPADTVSLSTGTNEFLNIESNSLQFIFGPFEGSGGNSFAPLEHFVFFRDLSPTAPIIVGLTYETDLPEFDASYLLFTDHTVTVGTGGISWTGGEFLNVNLQFIPEPSSFALLCIAVTPVIALRKYHSSRKLPIQVDFRL
jgi:hypothetical protein